MAYFNQSTQTYHQNIRESVQNNQYDIGLFNSQEVNTGPGLDGPQLDKLGDLFHGTSWCQEAHHPHSLFLAHVISL